MKTDGAGPFAGILRMQRIVGNGAVNRMIQTGAVIECNYAFNSDSTIVRLADDLETVSISGTGDASLQLALEIQRRYSKPLHAVDADYSFDIDLPEVNSLSEFKEKLAANG